MQGQEGRGVGPPSLFDVGAHARQTVEQALQRTEDRVQEDALALVDPGHEQTQGQGEPEEHSEVEAELHEGGAGHENSSGFSRATNR